jgi:hypothetical protein
VPRKLYANREVCITLKQQLRYRQARIVELRHRMEDCSLPADAGLIDCRAGIDVRGTVEEQRDRREVAVLRSHVQERSSRKRKVAPAGLAAIEFGETPIRECGIGVNQFALTIETATEGRPGLDSIWKRAPSRLLPQ